MKAKEIINLAYKGRRNIMTPKVLGYGKISETLAYEISQGTGLNHEVIYGVTFVRLNKDGSVVPEYDLSKMCWSKKEVKKYIQDVRRSQC